MDRKLKKIKRELYKDSSHSVSEEIAGKLGSNIFHDFIRYCKNILSADEFIIFVLRIAHYQYNSIQTTLKTMSKSDSSAERKFKKAARKLIESPIFQSKDTMSRKE